jgi:two-component system sensor histidine kinase MprB
MKLRTRLALVTAIAVAVAVVSVAGVAWLSTRNRLLHEIDRSLDARTTRGIATFSQPPPGRAPFDPRGLVVPDSQTRGPFGGQDTYLQVLDIHGNVFDSSSVKLPVSATDKNIATSGEGVTVRSTDAGSKHVRLRTQALPGGGAVQIARDLGETDRTLRGLALVLAVLSALGIVVAAFVGRATARRSLRPIDDLTDAAEQVARTQDLATPVAGAERDDEVGRLAASFNAMLQALAGSREQQQQLVSDASHELRTPLTSLRTAIELLQRAESMPAPQRRELIDHAVAELGELTHLVTELVELATDARIDSHDVFDVRLDDVTRSVAERAERRTDHTVLVDAQPWVVAGNPTLVERAVGNLVDNACKWGPPGTPIEVTVRDGEVRVRDHGPGVPADERERVFARFARGRDSQAVPGSGLGLAIVRQIADQHGGAAWLEDAPGGGTIAIVRFPGTTADFSDVVAPA